MGGGGGKGGKSSTEVSIPAWLEQAAQSGLARGNQAAGIGYVPYRGPDVAALTPMQEAAMANTSAASSAFGLGASPMPGAGMPAAQTFAGGVRGYSSAPLYDQAVNELKMRDPAQYAKLMAPFDGPTTFGPTSTPGGGGAVAPQSYGQPMREGPPQGSASSRNTKFDTYSTKADTKARAMSYGPQPKSKGFTSVKDMFDGGGPGASKSSKSSTSKSTKSSSSGSSKGKK